MFGSKSTALERQLATVRRLIGVAEQHAKHVAEVSPGSLHHELVEDAIAEGEYLLKEMGGVATRTAPVGRVMAHGQCQA